jgi:hypothetical protein
MLGARAQQRLIVSTHGLAGELEVLNLGCGLGPPRARVRCAEAAWGDVVAGSSVKRPVEVPSRGSRVAVWCVRPVG